VDQSSSNFFSSNAGGIALPILDNVASFQRYSRSKSELSGTKLTKFSHVLVPDFFGGSAHEFLDLHYKIQPASHHVAKFHGDWPRELGDPALKKNITGKT